MSTGHILLLGAIAGGTIFLGLPMARLQALGPAARAALSALATGILLFLLWDVLSGAVSPIEHRLEVRHWGSFAGYAALGVGGFALGLMSLVYYAEWMKKRSNRRMTTLVGPGAAATDEFRQRGWIEGLIERGERKEALLTATGRTRAERVVRKHRIIERLLTDFMGYTGYEAHERADELGDTFSDEMVERIDEKLGHPERCPHGWPVDPDVEQEENAVLAPLAALKPGTHATIVRLAEHDGELLHWFYDEGFVPGASVEVEAAEPAAGQFRVRLDGDAKAVSEKAAAGLFVKPAV